LILTKKNPTKNTQKKKAIFDKNIEQKENREKEEKCTMQTQILNLHVYHRPGF
jgi:hypothetical protein